MPTILAIVRKGLRLALTAVLTLAVLIGGSGVHTTSQCDAHEHGSPGLAVDLDAPEGGQDGDDGLCLGCDCACQPMTWNEAVALVQPVIQPTRLHRGPGQLTPDDVVFEIEPPPVLAS